MNIVTVAAIQMAHGTNNLKTAKGLVANAAEQGAQIILLQELFSTSYFCKKQKEEYLEWAEPVENHSWLPEFAQLAKDLEVVLPVSFYERANNTLFNSVIMFDADGTSLGVYRKSHIPDGPGYCEKFYFTPGDTGFKVWSTRYARIGVGICWDQWYPEAARSMALAGAEILLYPTAIGSEPQAPSLDSVNHWQRVMQGHAAANMVPIVASNRVGVEQDEDVSTTFYGNSFICDETGAVVNQLDRTEQGVCLSQLDLDAIQKSRLSWGLFRDRRPDLYESLVNH
jgi:N-carbamoylputrescine amidase